MKSFKEIYEASINEWYTGEPFVSFEDMSKAISDGQAITADKYKKINSKLKGVGEYRRKKVPGTTSSVPELVLYYTTNKKNRIILSQEVRYGEPKLILEIGKGYSMSIVRLDSFEISAIEKGLKELANELPSISKEYEKYGPFNFPKAFTKIVTR